jgi:hypothetical protein
MSNLIGPMLATITGLSKLRLYEDMSNEILLSPKPQIKFSKHLNAGSTRPSDPLCHGIPAINGFERRALAFPVNY